MIRVQNHLFSFQIFGFFHANIHQFDADFKSFKFLSHGKFIEFVSRFVVFQKRNCADYFFAKTSHPNISAIVNELLRIVEKNQIFGFDEDVFFKPFKGQLAQIFVVFCFKRHYFNRFFKHIFFR